MSAFIHPLRNLPRAIALCLGVCLALAAFLTVSSSAEADAATNCSVTRPSEHERDSELGTATATYNLRVAPRVDSNCNILGQVREGDAVNVIADRGGWLYIETSRATGGYAWISAPGVRRSEPITADPKPGGSCPSNESGGGGYWVDVKKSVGVFSGRSSAACSFLTTLRDGQRVQVVASDASWLKVNLPSGGTGWLFGGNGTTVRAAAPVTADPKPQGGPCPSDGSSGGGYWVDVEKSVGVFTGRNAETCSFITTLRDGQRVQVVASDGSWLKVNLPSGGTGWMFSGNGTTSRANPPVTADPKPQGGPCPSDGSSGGGYWVDVKKSVGVFTGRSSENCSFITTFKDGQRLQVVASDGSWLKVNLPSGGTGWLFSGNGTTERSTDTAVIPGRTEAWGYCSTISASFFSGKEQSACWFRNRAGDVVITNSNGFTYGLQVGLGFSIGAAESNDAVLAKLGGVSDCAAVEVLGVTQSTCLGRDGGADVKMTAIGASLEALPVSGVYVASTTDVFPTNDRGDIEQATADICSIAFSYDTFPPFCDTLIA